MDLSCEMRSSLSTKERMEIGIFRFFNHFSKMERGIRQIVLKKGLSPVLLQLQY